MITKFQNVNISGVSAAVPAQKVCVSELAAKLPKELAFKVRRTASLAGLNERYVVSGDTTVVTLAIAAGQELLSQLGWPAESVDALFFVTQTPDFLLPGSGYLIHHGLNLSSSCIVTDISASCSGMVHGLWAASAHVQGGGVKRALVLAGDVMSKVFRQEDIGNTILFGDAVGAMALEYRAEVGAFPLTFLVKSLPDVDCALCIHQSGVKTTEFPKGFAMDGAKVMDFTQTEVPEAVEHLLQHTKTDINSIDCFYFHQPNKSILEGLERKLGIANGKIPQVIDKFGNCSCASIPLAICASHDFKGKSAQALLCGFGGGFSVACLQAELRADLICSIKYGV